MMLCHYILIMIYDYVILESVVVLSETYYIKILCENDFTQV